MWHCSIEIYVRYGEIWPSALIQMCPVWWVGIEIHAKHVQYAEILVTRGGSYVWLPSRDHMSFSACQLGLTVSH
jgi:hypothetical protein